MGIQKRYNAIDVMKMIMAFNVVGIHVGTYFDLNYSSNVNFVLDMAVPFFFICSGFFIQNKVSKSNDLFCVLKRSFVRYLKLYLLWHIIYFPVALRFLLVNSHDFKENLIYCVHNFLFVGEIVLSWPLWYLHGLIVSIILVYFLYKIKLSLIQIWIVSIMLMLLGYFIGIASVSDEYSSIKAISQSIVGLLGSAERNGPFSGISSQKEKKRENRIPLHTSFYFAGGGIFILSVMGMGIRFL